MSARQTWWSRTAQVGPAALLLALASQGASAEATALRLWHAGTLFANMGQCAVVLSVDSYAQPIQGLRLQLVALDLAGKVVARGRMSFADFGQSEAQRYADGSWAAEALCDDGLSLRIEQAQAVVDGEKLDLLARQLLNVEDFKPWRIRLGRLPSKR